MARIIPKAEADGYRRWQLGSFDRPSPTPETADIPPTGDSAAPAEAPAMQEPAAEPEGPPAESIGERLAHLEEEARQTGYQRGHEEGLAAATAEFNARTAQQATQLAALVGNLHVSLAHLDQAVAEQLLDLALEIAGQVLRTALQADREVLLPTVREALAELPIHHGEVTLYLNPADAEVLTPLIEEQMAHTGARIAPSSDIAEGGCRIQAGNSEIDATIERRWQRVVETIGIKGAEWLPKN